MLRGTLSIGRWWGVELRLHVLLPVLLLASMAYSSVANGNATRGFGLWFALMLAVAVREVARMLTAAYVGLRVRTLFILPVGSVMALAPHAGEGPAPSTLPVTVAAPLANLVAGLLILGLAYAVDPRAQMLAQPWISPSYVLRSLMWMQLLLGVMNALPSASMPTRSLLRFGGRDSSAVAGPTLNLGTLLGFGLVFAGLLMGSLIGILAGTFALMLARFTTPGGGAAPGGGDDLLVRDVMLTEFSVLSTSDTLGSALASTVHSLHDVFPVVRGNLLVGSIARQALITQLQTSGDGYLQGSMSRSLQLVRPEETLVEALRRASGLSAGELLPVADGGRVVGILSPQNLARAVQQRKLTAARTAPERQELP